MPRVRIHRKVGTEFWSALAWYANRSQQAADHFAASFDAALEKIRLRPTANAPWRRDFRRVRVPHFPYLLIFHAGLQTTSILALVHERNEPARVHEALASRLREIDR